MRYMIMAVFAVACFVAGCECKPTPQQPSKSEPPPVVPAEKPQLPVLPSNGYLRGYRDGFSGTWLAPIRYALGDDYRNGWQAGAFDREHKNASRYPQ